jgi:hypothetical protein
MEMKVGHADGSVRIAVGTSKSTTSRIGIYSALPAVAISSATLSQANNTQSMLAHCDFIGWATKLRNGGAGKIAMVSAYPVMMPTAKRVRQL